MYPPGSKTKKRPHNLCNLFLSFSIISSWNFDTLYILFLKPRFIASTHSQSPKCAYINNYI